MIYDVTKQMNEIHKGHVRVSDVIKQLNEIFEAVLDLEIDHHKLLEEQRAARRKEHREENSRGEHRSYTYHDPNETD